MKKRTKITAIILSCLIILLLTCSLVSCGGGSGDGDATSDSTDTGSAESTGDNTGSAMTYASGPDYSNPFDTVQNMPAVTQQQNNQHQITQAETSPQITVIPENTSQKLSFESTGNNTCKLTGMGSCNDACVVIPEKNPSGESVTAIAERAFYGNNAVTAIQIPSSVTSIGDLAFASCPALVYISVSSGNTSYKSTGGVLYSADGKTIIAYPPATAASECKIPVSVTAISQMAFYNCKNLRVIRYGGTQAQWAAITIGNMNYSISSASVVCTDSGK